jgi:ketosteroid isomerase-like protein
VTGLIDERAVQDLIERKAIEDVLYRYASTIDQKDYTRLRSVFVDEAIGQYADAPEIHGADAIVGWIKEMCVGQGFQHHLINVYHVDVDLDQGTASALTYHTSHQIGTADPDTDVLIVGRYRDVLRKVGNEWKIVDKRMEVGWREERHYSQSDASAQGSAEQLSAQERAGSGR